MDARSAGSIIGIFLASLGADAFATDVVAGVGEFVGYDSGVAWVPGSRRYADLEDCLRDIFDANFSPHSGASSGRRLSNA